MSLNDIIDDNAEYLRVKVTEGMREAAVPVIHAYNQIPKAKRQRVDVNPAFDEAITRFKEATYEANPYLDPSTMRRDDGRPVFTQRLDMERASGKALNDLLADVAKQGGWDAPRPFDEKVRRL